MELTGHYDPSLVVTSVLVAVLASYAALDLAGRVTAASGPARLGWLVGGAVAMGTGIWSMHFIGMLAYGLPVSVQYDLHWVLGSVACALGASLLALHTVSRPTVSTGQIAVGGLLMGLAIAGMHYIGMAALRLPADIRYDRVLVAVSVLIAIVASWAALWLALRFREGGSRTWRMASAVVMGFAVVAMHYTGMSAAHFMAGPGPGVGGLLVATGGLAVTVISLTLVVLGLALVGAMIDRRIETSFAAPLREIEGRFRQLASIAEATSDYVGTADAQGRFLFLNRAGRTMLGIGLDEDVTGVMLSDVYPERMKEAVLAEQVSVAMRDGVWRGETWFQHRDGREIPISLVGMVHRDRKGEVEFLSAVARDVSEEVAVREALEAARRGAEQATAAKSSFLANMSHEIRTPMSGVLGMVELLQDTELTPEQRRSVDLIATSGEALLTVINDVLDFSKIEAGAVELEAIPFDLANLVHATVQVFAVPAFERGLELACEVRPDVPQRVRGDPGRLRQVLTNLVGNALKFSPLGEVVLTVALQRQENGRAWVNFEVRDTGIGVAPEKASAIFRPFGQADASTTRAYGGTGLGLSISRRLVELMGGAIELTSVVGEGSTFRFSLAFDVEADTAPPPQERYRLGIGGTRALVVDDHSTNRHIALEILALAAVRTGEAPSAEAALELLRSARDGGEPYHLVVSDVHMPHGDGFDLAAAIRAEPGISDTRIMLLTSGGERGDAQRCRDLGIAAYLLKPVSRIELLEAVITVLEGASKSPSEPGPVTRHSILEARRALSVLLAEDNPVNQQVAAAMLRKRGHDVDIVSDGRRAVAAVAGRAYDVVLMDLQMPELDGFAATTEIRATEVGRRIPIVALTANALSGERDRCIAAGMDDYLSKPFKAHDLFAIVEGWGTAGTELASRHGAAEPA